MTFSDSYFSRLIEFSFRVQQKRQFAPVTCGNTALDSRPMTEPNDQKENDQSGRCTCGGVCHGLREWSTSQELADWLGIDITALYWMRSRKHGPRGHTFGRGIMYRRRQVEEWLLTRLEDG
jgi:hypothetical protein